MIEHFMPRLRLIAVSEGFIAAEISDCETPAKLLSAIVPENWPPKFNSLETMCFAHDRLHENPEQEGW